MNRKNIFLFILFLFSIVSHSSHAIAKDSLNFEIVTSDEGFGTSQIVNFFDTASRIIDKYIKTDCVYQEAQIFFTETKSDIIEINSPNKNLLNVYFERKNFETIKNSSNERIKILRALTLFKLQQNIGNNNTKLDWIFDAFDKKFGRTLFPRNYPEGASFPGLHFLAINEIQISPETIIEYPVPIANNANYELYSELAEAFLNTLASIKNGNEILSDYLKIVCTQQNKKYQDSAKILYSIMINQTGSTRSISSMSEEITKCLDDKIFDMSVNFFMPASANFIAEKWALVTNVTYNPKNTPAIESSCDIEDMPEKINEMQVPGAVVNKLLYDLNKVKSYSPYYLKFAIANVIIAVEVIKPGLNNNDIAYVQDKIRESKIGFINALKKQQYLDNLLRQKEIEYVPQIKRLTPYLNASNSVNKSSLWPELDIYLNSIENQY